MKLDEALALARGELARRHRFGSVTLDSPASLRAVVGDEAADGYDRLDAALGLAEESDPAALPILRRVFDDRWFALTNSCNECGYAALALALLGDVESIGRLQRGPRVNIAGPFADLAIAILEGRDFEPR